MSKVVGDDVNKQGEVYSPAEYANQVVKTQQQQRRNRGMAVLEASKGVAADIRRNFGAIKERVMEKLAAAAVPAEPMENARQLLETIVKDVTVAAQGITKDALLRIKTHLVDILPNSLSPQQTGKMVDDAEREAAAAEGENKSGDEAEEGVGGGGHHNQQHQVAGKAPFISPASSSFASMIRPTWSPFSSRL